MAEFHEDQVKAAIPTLQRRALRLLGNHADAEDVVQDGLIAAYTHWHQFRGDSKLSTWLWAIVNNCAMMQLRKRVREFVPLDDVSNILVDHEPNPEQACHRARLSARLVRSAKQLSPTLRQTFYLRYVEDLSVREIARVLEIPTGSVKARLSRARARLQRSWIGA